MFELCKIVSMFRQEPQYLILLIFYIIVLRDFTSVVKMVFFKLGKVSYKICNSIKISLRKNRWVAVGIYIVFCLSSKIYVRAHSNTNDMNRIFITYLI